MKDKVDDAAEQAVEDAIKNGAGDDIDLDLGDGVAVPDSFPAEFPLPDGTLVASVAMEQGWQLSYEVDDNSEAEDLAAYFAADAAFEEVVNSAMGGIQTWIFAGETYSVTIGLIEDDSASQLSYLVVRDDG